MICKSCHRDIDFTLSSCPYCGASVMRSYDDDNLKVGAYIALGVRAILIIIGILGSFSYISLGGPSDTITNIILIAIGSWVLELISIYYAEKSYIWAVVIIVLGVLVGSNLKLVSIIISIVYIVYGINCLRKY